MGSVGGADVGTQEHRLWAGSLSPAEPSERTASPELFIDMKAVPRGL